MAYTIPAMTMHDLPTDYHHLITKFFTHLPADSANRELKPCYKAQLGPQAG